MVISRIERRKDNEGIKFIAGNGVGTVTLPGLPINVGEPAINPGPRKMIENTLEEISLNNNESLNINITIEVPEGEEIAKKTWNGRLGIKNGISILGTTGIVIPFSCSAWIHSIHRGVDVAKKTNIDHIAACTGSVSEKTTQFYYSLEDQAMIDMGDFVGGLLKYLKRNTIPRLTIAGGFAKIIKLSQGAMDLHSSRSQVDLYSLINQIKLLNIDKKKFGNIKKITTANQCLEILGNSKYDLSIDIANNAQSKILDVLKKTNIGVDVLIVDRKEEILANTDIKYA
jgi:cobalt-precorrin-5B (C1)-methyltransferase